MLVTFVIGLREGLEAALIVGIVSAFLIQNDRRRAMRPMWAGVLLAVAVCLGAAVALNIAGQRMPFQAREIMEGTLTVVAVIGVTYMLVWMRRHSSELRSDLESKTARALDSNSTWALVVLAFAAVLREGLETAVFLLSLLSGSSRPGIGLFGAVLGLATAVAIGYGIFAGGVRINLGRFFRVTGVLLVVIAAGLVASSIHSFAEGGLLTFGQRPAIDLSSVFIPGSLQAGLATAFLGFQPVPTYAELVAWALFLVPAGWYVLRGPARARRLAS